MKKSEDDLFHAYTNYGLGDTKQDRINRFLWWRKLTMTFNLAEVREVLDHFYKRGIVTEPTQLDDDDDDDGNSSRMKQFQFRKP